MLKIITSYLSGLGLILFFLTSCKKEARFKEAASYANAVFVNQSVVPSVGIKYQGEPITWNSGQKLRVLSGPGKFIFYNKNTGAVLLEKEFNIEPNQIDTLYFFQPDSTIAAQLIKDNQASESAAPAGYLKLRLANYANLALTNTAGIPYSKIDVIIQSTVTSSTVYTAIDTVMAVGTGLDTAGYNLVKIGVRAGALQNKFKFAFLDHDTKTPILNSGGTLYSTTAIFTAAFTPKNVFTIYFNNVERTANAVAILRKEKYYNVTGVRLF